MDKYNWNPVYNLVLQIKNDYIKKYGKLDTILLEDWLVRLNNNKYNKVFESLQINQFNEYVLIRYGLADMQEGMWTDPNSIYRECRSIVIDVVNEELALTPFRKFFNINEVEENTIKNITKEMNIAKSIEFSNKLDGSMQSARYYHNHLFMAGSMALDISNSWRLQDGYSKLTENHQNMIMQNPDYTFIFEYISLNDAHVVLYTKEQEGMYLVGIRNTLTGQQLSYNQIKQFAAKYNVSMTEIENRSFAEIMNDIKKFKSYEKEGWVANIDGHMVKIKCDDYVHLHRLLDKISSINVIIQNIADGTYDDLICKVPENYKERVNKIAKIIFQYVKTTKQQIYDYYNQTPKETKKDFMIWVDTNIPKDIRSYVKQEYLGQEWNVLKNGHGANSRYKKLKEMGITKSYSALFVDMEEV